MLPLNQAPNSLCYETTLKGKKLEWKRLKRPLSWQVCRKLNQKLWRKGDKYQVRLKRPLSWQAWRRHNRAGSLATAAAVETQSFLREHLDSVLQVHIIFAWLLKATKGSMHWDKLLERGYIKQIWFAPSKAAKAGSKVLL